MAIQPFAMQGQVANIMLPSEAIQYGNASNGYGTAQDGLITDY